MFLLCGNSIHLLLPVPALRFGWRVNLGVRDRVVVAVEQHIG